MNKRVIIVGGIAAAVLAVVVSAAIGNSAGVASAEAAAAAVPAVTVVQTSTVTKTPAPVTKTQTVTETVTPAPVTVTETAPPPAPVTVTAPAPAPAASADPGGAKKNGKYLIGSQVSGGTWQCDNPGSLPYWSVNAQDNEIIDNGIDSIAIVPDSGYTLELDGCNSLWNKVG